MDVKDSAQSNGLTDGAVLSSTTHSCDISSNNDALANGNNNKKASSKAIHGSLLVYIDIMRYVYDLLLVCACITVYTVMKCLGADTVIDFISNAPIESMLPITMIRQANDTILKFTTPG